MLNLLYYIYNIFKQIKQGWNMKVFLKLGVFILICCIFLCACSDAAVNTDSEQAAASVQSGAQPKESAQPEPTPTPTPEPKRQQDLNIAVSVLNSENSGDALFINGIEEIFEAKGNKYEILDAGGLLATQASQIENASAEEYDAIIITTENPETIAEAANKAAENIPVITAPQIEGVNSDYYINVDNEAVLEAAQIFADSFDEGRRVVIISTGEQTESLESSVQAFTEAAETKELEIVSSKNAQNREQAVAIISNWMLANPYIKGIWAPSPEALSAALEVVTVMQRDDVKIGGFGEDLEFITALGDEKITVLAAQNPKLYGELAARAALVLGTESYYPESAEGSYIIYTPDTYKEAAAEIWQIDLSEVEKQPEDEE